MTNLTSEPTTVKSAIAEALKEEPVQIKTIAPSNTEVTLPGGYVSGDGSLVKYAVVRELNGADEEAIAKAGSYGRALNVILSKGLVSIGDETVNRELLDDLLAADRDAILLAIRRVTFGDEVNYSTLCDHCNSAQQFTIDLDKDIPVVTLQDPIEDRRWATEIKSGTAVVTLPSGDTQKKLMENSDKTTAELNTILLSGCVLSINNKASYGAQTVLKLGMGERETLVEEIIAKNPGPRLGEVSKTCEACGENVRTPLSLVGLFRL